MIRLLVGLGNPGPEYEDTRHNVGFWWVDAAARALGTRLVPERAYQGLLARVNRPDGPLWLLEPQTYMNLSGRSVAALARFFKIEPDQILVVHDELDLPPGQMKIKQGGGVAGHNGLKDIQAQLGSADFWRLRIGIGHPGDRAEVANWVLRKPAPDQREAMLACLDRSLQALPQLLEGPTARALAAIHARPSAPGADKAKPPKAKNSVRGAQPTEAPGNGNGIPQVEARAAAVRPDTQEN
ncbi:MAG: aminoacyl-tRNA hydrolase [Aquabacterium sp.]|nr:aminoacyl-tRNA hydrolase [Aquabacterium sp.]